ncbi:uncharacterized protein LOC120374477 [Mauremys reevesii]|uniref:uncharacterized protein LOC120374477 n=1 Tax=Mauremys reevesii TaxID=260615 RepID=UPI00193EE93E|nr:uncharacterized protein LOC120374477 [Mauremys reevesii]
MGGAGGSGGSCWPCGALAVSSPHGEVSAGPESLMLLCLLRVSQELIEELPKDSPPSEILSSCLAAVGNLSTMKPALEPELESRLLQAALGSVFTLGTETDATDIQALHKVMPELLDAVLGNLLVFGKFFSVGQRKCFLKTAVPAIYNPLLCISQAGLLLTYAILGEAEQLLGYTLEDTTAKVMGQLRSIRQLHQVPEVMQGLSLT